MSEFDIDDPPTSYRKFRRSIMNLVAQTEIDADEEFPVAMFLVSRNGDADIVYPEDALKELDFDEEEMEDVPMALVVNRLFPSMAKFFSTQFFSLVFQGTHTDPIGNDTDIVVLIMGSGPTKEDIMGGIEVFKSDIYLEEGDEVTLDPWEEISVETFSELVENFRKATTLQG